MAPNPLAPQFMAMDRVWVFFTPNGELSHHADYQTRAQARTKNFEFIEVVYIRTLRHSTLDYHTPLLYERQTQQQSQARLVA